MNFLPFLVSAVLLVIGFYIVDVRRRYPDNKTAVILLGIGYFIVGYFLINAIVWLNVTFVFDCK